MKITEKLNACQNNLYAAEIPTVAFTGDSVTQGCFECYPVGESGLSTVFEEKSGYVRRVQEIFSLLYPSAKINVINAGLNGADVRTGLKNLEQNVLRHRLDLTVVSYGLNDSVAGENGIDRYGEALGEMLDRIIENGGEALFVTQNFMCEKTSDFLKDKIFIDLSKDFAALQNGGVLDKYFERAKEVCARRGVKVCDVRASWQAMKRGGVNVTELLANKLNHPIREFSYYTAMKIVESIFEL